MTIDAPLAWHVIIRLVDGRIIAPRAARRRLLTRTVHRHGRGRGLLAYRLAGDHLHVLLVCSRVEAGKFTHAVETALRAVLRLPVAFEAARIRPVAEQRHLENAYRYVLRQEKKHGIVSDPTHDASSLADLWGLRVIGGDFRELQRDLLPGTAIGREEVGFTRADLVAAPMAIEHLADAAAAALALATIRGKGSDRRAARAAAVHVGRALGLKTPELGALLGMHPSGVRRLAGVTFPPDLPRAIELQLRLRGLLAGSFEAPASAVGPASGVGLTGAA